MAEKKIKIMVGCNLLTQQDSIAYVNHMQMWYNYGKAYQDLQFFSNMPRRQPIDVMRNNTARKALEWECDYVFFYDDDVIVPIDGLRKLLKLDVDVAAGLTFIRTPPFKPMIFEMVREGDNGNLIIMEDYKDKVNEKGIVDCYAVGFSCVLLKVSALKTVMPPYFMTGSRNTEDVYYCCKLKDVNPKATIAVDTTISTKHMLDKVWVDAENVEKLRKFFANDEEDLGDRSYAYAKQAMESVA